MTSVADMTPEEALQHYGVLGMKWGKTRARATGTQVRAARRGVQKDILKYRDQQDVVRSLNRSGTDAQRAAAQTKLAKIKTSYLANPDRVVAQRLTRGEKAAVVLLFGPVGVAGIAAGSAASRRIEYKQENRQYHR